MSPALVVGRQRRTRAAARGLCRLHVSTAAVRQIPASGFPVSRQGTHCKLVTLGGGFSGWRYEDSAGDDEYEPSASALMSIS